MSLTQEQTTNAEGIIGAVKGDGLSASDTAEAEVIAIMTALTESGLHVYTQADEPGTEGSSLGLFQQLTGWGSVQAREDPVQSTRLFLNGGAEGQKGLTEESGWDTMAPWVAAQGVQQSEFGDGSNYQATYSEAVGIVNQLGGLATPITGSNENVSNSNPTPPVNGGQPGTIPRPIQPGYTGPATDPLDQLYGLVTGDTGTGTFGKGGFFALIPGLIEGVTWLINPSHWLRIGAGLGAMIVLALAGYMIATSE